MEGFTRGDVTDGQMSALAMAVFFRGMSEEECAALTGAMMRSGDVLDLSAFGDSTVDKHSTGGVGDKTTVVLAPLCAAMGLKVAKMSGRGLGHTGGTVDKLESVEGFRAEYSGAEFLSLVERYGIAVAGQSLSFVPADKKLYALRDECAEVESIPLIASSIMSKKLACGAKNIVLDVKCGSGAFMKDSAEARALGEAMVRIGRAYGRRVTALVTDMDVPLGRAVGNAVEVNEAVEVLRGEGPSDLRELCLTVAAVLHSMSTGVGEAESLACAKKALFSGEAYTHFLRWISAQGGDVSVFDDGGLLPVAEYSHTVCSPVDGYVGGMDSEAVGNAALLLGAGRKNHGDSVDHGVGILVLKKKGERIACGEPLFTVIGRDGDSAAAAGRLALEGVTVTDSAPAPTPLILDRVNFE